MHVDGETAAELAARTIKYDINVYFCRLCALNVNDRNAFGIFKTDEKGKKNEANEREHRKWCFLVFVRGTGTSKVERSRKCTENKSRLIHFQFLYLSFSFDANGGGVKWIPHGMSRLFRTFTCATAPLAHVSRPWGDASAIRVDNAIREIIVNFIKNVFHLRSRSCASARVRECGHGYDIIEELENHAKPC